MEAIKFENNSMTENSLRAIAGYFCGTLILKYDSARVRTKLLHLEIVNNELTNESFETIATCVFKENKGLKTVNLSNNWFGV